jgi:hypothetical protein
MNRNRLAEESSMKMTPASGIAPNKTEVSKRADDQITLVLFPFDYLLLPWAVPKRRILVHNVSIVC